MSLQSFEKASHLGLLKDDRAIGAIVKLVKEHSDNKSIRRTPAETFSFWPSSFKAFWTGEVPRRQLTDRGDAYTLRHPHQTVQ